MYRLGFGTFFYSLLIMPGVCILICICVCVQMQMHGQRNVLDRACNSSFMQLQPAVACAAGVVRLAQIHTDACEYVHFSVLRMHVCI